MAAAEIALLDTRASSELFKLIDWFAPQGAMNNNGRP
jgi:hypothetical protein